VVVSAVLAVTAKELREMIRDGNTLLYTLLFPVVFYPFIIWGVFQLALLEEGLAEAQPPRVVYEGPPDVADVVLAPPVEAVQGDELAVRRGQADAVVVAATVGGAVHVDIAHQSTLARSVRTVDTLSERLDASRGERTRQLAVEAGLEEDALDAWTLEEEDVAPKERALAHGLSLVLPAMTLMVATIAAMYPAVDVVVGEKERGTVETTLVAAAPRMALVTGKLVAVVAVVLVALLGNLLATGLCIAQGLTMVRGEAFGSFFVLTQGAVAVGLVTLTMTVLLVASVMVLVALPAKSFKEAQNLATAAVFVIGLLAMASSLPLSRLDASTAFVPVMNLGLVLREALDGRIHAGWTAAVLLESAALSGAALWAGLRIAQSEAYLFRGQVPRWLGWIARLGGAT